MTAFRDHADARARMEYLANWADGDVAMTRDVICNKWRQGPGFFSRWTALAAGFLVNAFNLYSYAYGLFSETLKDELNFSQSAVDIIASVGDLGLWSTFLVGLLLEWGSPRKVYFIGSVTTLVGLGYVSLAIDEFVPSGPMSMAVMFYLANFGTACYTQAATAVVVRNFPLVDRGKVSGLIKSVFGLSSAILSVLYTGLLGATHVGRFLFILSIGVPILGSITSIPLNIIPEKHLSYAIDRAQGVLPNVLPYYTWFICITSFLVIASLLDALGVSLPTPWTGFMVVAAVMSVAFVPFTYGRTYIRDTDGFRSRETSTGSENSTDRGTCQGRFRGTFQDDGLEDDTLGGETSPLLGAGGGVNMIDEAVDNCNLTWRQCLQVLVNNKMRLSYYKYLVHAAAGVAGTKDIRFWTLYVGFLCGAGSGLVVINNVSSLAESLGMSSSTLLVTILGIANATGRLSAGWISDRVIRAGLPRAFLFFVMLLITCCVDLLLAVGMKSLLYPLCVAAGVCYGSMFSLVLALAGDLFGPKHIGTNYGLLDLGPAAGSFLFATGVVDYFYNREGDGGDCYGAKCFRGTFFCTATACILASYVVFVVLVRPRFRLQRRQAHA